MSRIRSIKPDFFSDVHVTALSLEARLTYIGLWTEADDAGRARDLPKQLAGALWPNDKWMTPARMQRVIAELAKAGRIIRYQVDGETYIQVKHWEHQKINHPSASRFPEPPRNIQGSFLDDLPEASGNPPVSLPEGVSPRVRARDLGSRNLDLGGRKEEPPPPAFTVPESLRAEVAKRPNLAGVDLEAETAAFVAHCAEHGTQPNVKGWQGWMRGYDPAKARAPSMNGPTPPHAEGARIPETPMPKMGGEPTEEGRAAVAALKASVREAKGGSMVPVYDANGYPVVAAFDTQEATT